MKTDSKDSLGDRMKAYEEVTRYSLIPRSYTIIRVDGRAFHSYTKGLKRPFDNELIEDLDNTWKYLCQNIQNAKLGYAQSDEFTLLLTDFDEITTQQFFGGNIQKICSVVASMAAAKFNQLRIQRYFAKNLIKEHFNDFDPSRAISVEDIINYFPLQDSPFNKLAEFDCRVFNLPSAIEVYNNFLWRWKDCERNSISSVAYANFPHKQLEGKNNEQKQEMLWKEKGINWSKLEDSLKNGRFLVKEKKFMPPAFPTQAFLDRIKENAFAFERDFTRENWKVEPCWKLSEDPQKLKDLIPQQ